MATRKVKRFDEGGDTEFGDLEGAMDKANARAVQDQFNANEAASEAPKATTKAAPKTEAKAAPKAEAKSAPVMTRMSKEAGEAARAKFRESSKPAEAKPAAKKEMYRTFGGEFKEKSTEPGISDRMSESIGRGLKSAGESIGSYLKSLGQREEKHGTYKTKDASGKDKIVKYAKGGMTASKRADGIASRGKTRGKIC